jgi:hypothetical protein
MKTCPVCDLELDDSYSFCPEDGSTLQNQAINKSIIHPPGDQSYNEPQSVVLSCPNCAAEYPLTFSECPVHGVTLTKQTRPIARSQIAGVAAVPDSNSATDTQFKSETDLSTAASIHSIDSRSDAPEIADTVDSTDHISENPSNEQTPSNRFPDALKSFESANDERPGFRIAAIITAIVLAIFAIASLVGLASHLSRRPSSVTQIARAEDAKPLPFVATPQEAQDYTDEQQPPSEPAAPSRSATEPRTERRRDDVSAPSNDHTVHKITLTQASPTPASTPAAQPHQSAAADAPAPALPRGNSGGFDSRLIRARGSRTSSGYRYELTFSMLEQAGRSAQWQRVLISSHSASGMNHTQALPFVHRLGAAGALTFTISVELAGHSEPDWRGRVICTALGWDNSGAPLQSSFGANLIP